MLRVLVADDSPTERALLVTMLSSDPNVQVVAEASDGVEAVELTRKLRPDLVTMDILMPRLDGFEATKQIMTDAPTPIVVVTGRTDAQEVAVSMQALRAGALCVLRKPPGPHAPDFKAATRQLVDTVKAMAEVKVVGHHPLPPPRVRPVAPSVGPRLVAIAASTGGPAALHQMLSQLPADFPAAILIVQHITSGFSPGLAKWLNGACTLSVRIAQNGDHIAPGTVYFAPDERHLGVGGRGWIELSDAPPIAGFRPSANFLFESAAHAYGARVLAVVLTGMGNDGVAGLRTVHERGGHVIAQDESTSVVFGMPRAAIAAGLVDQVLPLGDIAVRLASLVGEPAYERVNGGRA